MAMTFQVLYPVTEGATFDHDYYGTTHMKLVERVMGPNGLSSASASRGLAGGPDTPSPYFAIATMTFPDEATMNNALAGAGELMADLANFTNIQPQIMIGSVM